MDEALLCPPLPLQFRLGEMVNEQVKSDDCKECGELQREETRGVRGHLTGGCLRGSLLPELMMKAET